MNNCLSRFYLTASRQDGGHYKKTIFLLIRGALDRYFRSVPLNKKFSICDGIQFNEANKALNSYLKNLASNGKIAGTIHKNSITTELNAKVVRGRGIWRVQIRRIFELCCEFAGNNAVLHVTVFRQIKRGRENQSLIKKSMLRLVVTTSGEEYEEHEKSKKEA